MTSRSEVVLPRNSPPQQPTEGMNVLAHRLEGCNNAILLLEKLGVTVDELSARDSPPIPSPMSSSYLDTDNLDQVVDRGPFLAGFAKVVLGRYFLGYDDPEKRASLKEHNPLMAAFAPSGSGKTYSIGLLMELTRRLFSGGADSNYARQYLINELDEKWGSFLADYLTGYVVLPITFNLRQPFTLTDTNPKVMVLARILSCVINNISGKKASVEECSRHINQIYPGGAVGWDQVYEILDLLFQGKGRQVKYIFAVDELFKIEDVQLRLGVLSNLCHLMDCRQSSLVYSTSLEVGTFLDLSTLSNREACLLPLTRCPSLILQNEKLMDLIRCNRVFISVLIDLCGEPKQIANEAVVRDLSKNRNLCLGDILTNHYKVDQSLIDKMSNESLSEFVSLVMEGKPVEYKKVVGEILLQNGQIKPIKLSDLFAYGMLVSLGVLTALNSSVGVVSDFVPETTVPIIIRAITKIDEGRAATRPTAAFWIVALCLVAPWVTDGARNINGEGFELFFAMNELLRRQTAYYGNDNFAYFASYEDSQTFSCRPANMGQVHRRLSMHSGLHSLPVTLHPNPRFAFMDLPRNKKKSVDKVPIDSEVQKSKHKKNLIKKKPLVEVLIDNIDAALNNLRYYDANLLSTQFVKFRCNNPTMSQSSTKGVLTLLADEDFQSFCRGGVLLMNLPSGPGYDFVIGDNEILTFYEVKYTKPQDAIPMVSSEASQDAVPTVSSQTIPKAEHQGQLREVTEKYEYCESEFKEVSERKGNVFTKWRLIFISYRDYAVRKRQENLFIVGPQEITKMFPPTLLSRLEFSKFGSEKELLENYILQMKKTSLENLNELDEEASEEDLDALIETDSEPELDIEDQFGRLDTEDTDE